MWVGLLLSMGVELASVDVGRQRIKMGRGNMNVGEGEERVGQGLAIGHEYSWRWCSAS